MTARITVEQAKAWLEPTKIQHPDSLDADLLAHVETEVVAQIASSFDTSTWVDTLTTPKLVQTTIAKMYAALYIDKIFSEDVSKLESSYVQRLLTNVSMLITGIVGGSITIVEVGDSTVEQPVFYPNDNSSIQDPRDNNSFDTSLGPAAFSMGQVF